MGSGKSWFIKNYIDRDEKNKYLYVSLYGVTSYKEIEDAFFQQLHPLLSSKGMKIAGVILKGVLKTAIKVDWDGDKKEDGTISSTLPDINLPDYLKNTDKSILVFDDLERCSIPIGNILGYINQLVEYKGLKVVIIANEEEIIKKDNLEGNNGELKKYLSIKEKLIGKSLELQVDFHSAVDNFILEVENEEIKKILTDQKGLLYEIFIESGYNNLRHVRQIIFDLERFFLFFDYKTYKNEALIHHLLSLFFAISFEIRKGVITEDDISNLLALPFHFGTKDEAETPIKGIKKKYDVFKRYNHPITSDTLFSFYKSGTIDKAHLDESINNSVYFIDEKKPDWIKLWYFYDLEDEEFETLYHKVFNQFNMLQISNIYELLQITGMLLAMSNDNSISSSKAEIITIGKNNVDKLKKEGKLQVPNHDDFPSTSSHGLAYQGKEFEEFGLFCEYIRDQARLAKEENYPKIAEELLDTLRKSVNEFVEKICLENSTNNLYYEIPILKYIDVNRFAETLLSLTNTKKKEFSWSFHKRYRIPQFNTKLTDELQWIESLHEILEKKSNENVGKVTARVITVLLLPMLKSIIVNLKNAPSP